MELLSIQYFFGAAGAAWVASWLPLTILAVIVAILIHTIMLMIARAFSIKELEAFAMSEILQAGANAFIAIFLVVMVGSAMDVARSFIHGDIACGAVVKHIGTTTDSTMDEAFSAIRCRLQTRAIEVAGIQDSVTSGAGTWASFNALNLGLSVFGITFFKGDWVASLYKSTESTRITNNLATVLLIGLNAQSFLLEYLRANMLNVFVPVGILMRSFYFTRGPGALLIAMGIGLYFIFPIFFVLLDPGFTASPPPTTANVPMQPPYCYATMTNTLALLTSIQNAGLGSTGDLTAAANGEDLSKSYVTLILHPLVAFFLTMVFVRYMMSVLGGDTYELTKMITKVV